MYRYDPARRLWRETSIEEEAFFDRMKQATQKHVESRFEECEKIAIFNVSKSFDTSQLFTRSELPLNERDVISLACDEVFDINKWKFRPRQKSDFFSWAWRGHPDLATPFEVRELEADLTRLGVDLDDLRRTLFEFIMPSGMHYPNLRISGPGCETLLSLLEHAGLHATHLKVYHIYDKDYADIYLPNECDPHLGFKHNQHVLLAWLFKDLSVQDTSMLISNYF